MIYLQLYNISAMYKIFIIKINDNNNLVTIIIDSNLKNKVLLMHPEVNTKTLAIRYQDLLKYIKYLNHDYIIFG